MSDTLSGVKAALVGLHDYEIELARAALESVEAFVSVLDYDRGRPGSDALARFDCVVLRAGRGEGSPAWVRTEEVRTYQQPVLLVATTEVFLAAHKPSDFLTSGPGAMLDAGAAAGFDVLLLPLAENELVLRLTLLMSKSRERATTTSRSTAPRPPWRASSSSVQCSPKS